MLCKLLRCFWFILILTLLSKHFCKSTKNHKKSWVLTFAACLRAHISLSFCSNRDFNPSMLAGSTWKQKKKSQWHHMLNRDHPIWLICALKIISWLKEQRFKVELSKALLFLFWVGSQSNGHDFCQHCISCEWTVKKEVIKRCQIHYGPMMLMAWFSAA